MIKHTPIVIFLSILLFASFAGAQSRMAGTVVEVLDGRTVVIDTDGRRITAEIQYIEVPEADQPLHRTVRDHLAKLILGKAVEFRPQGFSTGKTFGQLFTGAVDIGVQMLRDGAAWHVPVDKSGQGVEQNAAYKDHQDQARTEKRGVWGINGMKPAWEHRAEKKERERQSRTATTSAGAGEEKKSNHEKAAETKKPPRMPGIWGDVNPWLKNLGPLMNGYNAATRTGYVGTSLMGVKELQDRPIDRRTAVDVTYIYTQEGEKGRKGTFVLNLVSSAAEWQFLKTNTLSVIVDEKNVLAVKPKRTAAREDGRAVEKLSFEVNKATIEKIVYGGEVFVKIGDLILYPSQGFQLLLYNMLQVAE